MKTLNYKGYEVEIYEGYNGDQILTERNGEKVYSARVSKAAAETRNERHSWLIRKRI